MNPVVSAGAHEMPAGDEDAVQATWQSLDGHAGAADQAIAFTL